jgi:hypothetical protein
VPYRQKITCPQCAGSVDRIPRRLVDRLASLFAPVHRYRCRACNWEGNVSLRSPDLPHRGAAR